MKQIKVSNINLRLRYYRVHKNNASKNHVKQIKAALFVKKKNLKYIVENELLNFKDLLEIIFYYYIYFFYANFKNISYKILKKN